jgi:DNA-binding HxlR family transcriptional regulator
MDPEPKDLMVLGAIMRGERNFDKIKKNTKIDAEELNSILEKLEERGLIRVQEKRGLFGPKVEMFVTEKGSKEVDERIYELQQKWDQMSLLYKTGDKNKLKQYMDENKSILPTMMFFGIMDIMMFSMMFSMMGMMMTDYVPQDSIPQGTDGMNEASEGADSGDGGFDFDIGF